MALPFYNWSRTAASNATADSTVNWAEGMPPSAVNDSARAMMASTAAYRDDVAGAITTGGTSTAYTVTSYQIFSSLTVLNGQCIAFVPHATNGATVTLNVDGLGAKPLRSAPSVELVAGTLIQGTPYTCTYNSSDAVFYLRDFYINPYVVPIGGMIDFWGASVPSSSFVFPIGQAISRTTYSALFTLFSTTYGTGDGSTTFNVPDVTGRVTAMKEASATRLTSTYFGGTSTSLGAVGGLESHTLTTAQLPCIVTALLIPAIRTARRQPWQAIFLLDLVVVPKAASRLVTLQQSVAQRPASASTTPVLEAHTTTCSRRSSATSYFASFRKPSA
jgi:microcystin-dependent protein